MMTRVPSAEGISASAQAGSKRKATDNGDRSSQKKIRIDSESKEERVSEGNTAGRVILSQELSNFFSRHSPAPIDPHKLWARTEVKHCLST